MLLSLGTRLGPYDIIAPLGAGGMGEVYKARDTRLDRDVALKVLPSSLALDPDQGARFEREAKAVAALSHPNILAIFDFAVIDGVACAATELLNGETLRARLDAGPLSVRRAVDTTVQIARGLAAAHDKGIIHRDLKPENVFLLEDGHVKILDFGLAKTVADSSGGNHETVVATDPGVIMGTVGYMAPEQVRGQALDARADVFALGVILYEMLSGRRAFQRETAAETMTAILKEDPPELTEVRADVPPGLEAIVRHCLERNPAERFQSARDLAFNLQVIQPAGSGPAVPLEPPGFLSRFSWREGIAWALVAAFALGFIGSSRRSNAPPVSPVVRLQVTAPEQTTWASPLGAPEGSNGGTISPDGTMIAFVAGDASGRTLLWIRPIDTFSARPVAGTDGAAFPFWSPDSRALGFFTTTKLKRIAVDGGPAQTLCELASTPRGGAWNQRGVILIGTTGSFIRRISAEGGQLTPVTGEDSQNAGQQWPYFLPDGEHFLFYSARTRAVFVGSLGHEADSTERFERDLRGGGPDSVRQRGLAVRASIRCCTARGDGRGATGRRTNLLGGGALEPRGFLGLPNRHAHVSSWRGEPNAIRLVRPSGPRAWSGGPARRLSVPCALARRNASGVHAS